MRRLIPALLALPCLTACGPTDEAAVPEASEVPIVAPDPAWQPTRCPDARVVEGWAFTWERDRLLQATRTHDGEAVTHRLQWGAEGLEGWTNDGPHAGGVSFERDEAGQVVRWTREDAAQPPLTVGVTHLPDGVELHVQGALYAELLPVDAEVFDLAAQPDVAAALPTMSRLLELLVYSHAGDDVALEQALLTADYVERRRWDGEGRITRVGFDVDRDGVEDLVETRSYGDGAEQVTLDLDGDGTPEQTTERQFDDQGRLVREAQAGGARTSWVHEPNLRKALHDADGDGVHEAETWLYLNAHGKRALKYEDRDANGLAEWRRRYLHNEAGQRVLTERDNNGDGIIDDRVELDIGPGEQVVAVRRMRPDADGCGGRW